jgi:glutamate N-acetyltransferase/amino-acid N-acetyltransferase
MTTDLVPKSIALETTIGDRTVRVGGICKGSGMIHPNMANPAGICYLRCYCLHYLVAQMLSRAADKSFNQITLMEIPVPTTR